MPAHRRYFCLREVEEIEKVDNVGSSASDNAGCDLPRRDGADYPDGRPERSRWSSRARIRGLTRSRPCSRPGACTRSGSSTSARSGARSGARTRSSTSACTRSCACTCACSRSGARSCPCTQGRGTQGRREEGRREEVRGEEGRRKEGTAEDRWRWRFAVRSGRRHVSPGRWTVGPQDGPLRAAPAAVGRRNSKRWAPSGTRLRLSSGFA